MKQLRILFVEDLPTDFEIAKREISREKISYTHMVVDTPEGFKKALAEFKPDIIICDYAMPKFDGMSALKIARSQPNYIPFIILTGSMSEETAVACMKAGADDYVLKEKIRRLPFAVREMIGVDLLKKEKDHALQNMIRSEIKYGLLIEQLNEGLMQVDNEGRILFVNEKFCEMFGYLKDEVIGKDGYRLLGGRIDKQNIEVNKEQEHKIKLAIKNMEMKAKKKSGELIWLSINASVVTENNGDMDGFVMLMSDITERKKAESETNRLITAIEQAGEVFIVTDNDRTIQYVNPAFEAVTGYSREEAVGQNYSMLVSAEQDEAFYRNLWETVAGGMTWKGRIVNKRKDGTLYSEDATISPVKDASGETVNFVAVKRDITEHLRISQEQSRLQEQLQQVQKLESIGRLAGGVAHDFNNMLSVILGYGGILLNSLSPEDPLREDVKQIMEAGKRSAALTRQLLAFSRKQSLQLVVLNLNSIVRNLEKMLRRLIGEDIELILELSEDISPILADAGQIEQVIMNLAVNARDAMPQGGRLLIETTEAELDETFVSKHTGSKQGKYVLMSVSDTGCGMTREVINHIFEPYFTTKERGKGTGLGLSTIYGIIKQSAGNVWVYSEPGQGTTFKIYLPQTQAGKQKIKVEEKTAKKTGHGEHILVVEDEESLRKLIQVMLESLGYQVTIAANGVEALIMMEEQGMLPDLVITDIVMPKMSGRQLAEQLHRNQPELKVLYMSGYTENTIVQQGQGNSGLAYIQKPFSIQDLAEKVYSALQDKQ